MRDLNFKSKIKLIIFSFVEFVYYLKLFNKNWYFSFKITFTSTMILSDPLLKILQKRLPLKGLTITVNKKTNLVVCENVELSDVVST